MGHQPTSNLPGRMCSVQYLLRDVTGRSCHPANRCIKPAMSGPRTLVTVRVTGGWAQSDY